jgi:hypothetical protein
MMAKQVSVPLDGPLLAFIERGAEREMRSTAGQIRYLISEAARRSGAGLVEGEPWPPVLASVTGDDLPAARSRLSALDEEIERLEAVGRATKFKGGVSRHRFGLTLQEESRLSQARTEAASLRASIKALERLAANGNGNGGV